MTRSAQWSTQKVAALSYFIYGVVYLVGAILELDPSRRVIFWGFVPWWAFYVAGGLILATIPIFIMRGIRWLIWVITLFVSAKCLWLVWIQARNFQAGVSADLYNLFFAAVAGITAILLLRAALTPAEAASPPSDAPNEKGSG